MKSNESIVRRLTFTSVLLFSTTTGHAQTNANQPSTTETTVLSKFEVNAARDVGYFSSDTLAGTRAAKPLVDIPGSIAIINHEMLSDFNTMNQDNVLKYGVSGVTPNDEVIDDLNIRGFRQVNPFRDGVESSGAFINQTYDVDRIEVVKGPSAMVFGNAGVVGGTVNYISRRPSGIPVHDLKVTVGENNFVRSELNLGGPIASRKDVRYRLTLGAQNDDRTKEIESDDQTFIGGALEFNFGSTTLSMTGYRFNKTGYTFYDDFLDNRVTSGIMKLNPNSTATFSPAKSDDVYTDQLEHYFATTIVTQLNPDLVLKGFYRFRGIDDRRRMIRGTIPVGTDNYTLRREDRPQHVTGDAHTIQVDLVYDLTTGPVKQELSAGVDYSRVNATNYQAPTNSQITSIDTRAPDFSADKLLPMRAFNFAQETLDETTSFYAQDTASMLDKKIQLIAGIRWVGTRKEFQNHIIGPTATTIDDISPEHVSRYGLVYQPRPDLSVYYVNADGFTVNTGTDHLGRALKNSRGTNSEFGVKLQDLKFAGGRIFTSAAYFDMALTNVKTQGNFIPELGLIEILQSAQDTSKGYEFDFGYVRPAPSGDMTVIFTYYRAKSRTATGFRPKNAAERVASLMLKYRFNQGGLKGLSVGAGWYAEGEKFGGGQLYMDSDDIYDAFATYDVNPKWSLGVNIRNLTNERFATSYFNAGLVSSNDPRAILFNVRYRW